MLCARGRRHLERHEHNTVSGLGAACRTGDRGNLCLTDEPSTIAFVRANIALELPFRYNPNSSREISRGELSQDATISIIPCGQDGHERRQARTIRNGRLR